MGAIDRGIPMTDLRTMTIGEIVDYCVAYNNRQKQIEKKEEIKERKGTTRKATQADWDAFLG